MIVLAVGYTKAAHEQALDRRVQEHPGYDQMSPVDREMLRGRCERGEAPRPGPDS